MGRQRRGGRQEGERRSEDHCEGPGKTELAHTRSPARTGHSDAPARDTPPPQKDQEAHSPGALRGAGARGRSHSQGPPSGFLTAPSPGCSRLPRGSGDSSATATSPPSGCWGQADALTAAGAPLAQARCGQHEAAVAACGLFPPFINPAQGMGGGRGRAERRDLAGGGRAGRGRGRKTSVPAGGSLWSCVRGLAAPGAGGPQTGRPALRRARGRGRSGERGSGHRRRNLPSGGWAAKDTCRLPGLRGAGASAQRPAAGLLRSGGARSHAIHTSAHLRVGRQPWLVARGRREVAKGRGTSAPVG